MSKGLDEKTKYEINVYGKELNKDLTNLMECLKKQDEDNKAILYVGRYFKKVILPYEEYQKMRQRLGLINNSKPSEALELVGYLKDHHLNAIPYYDWLNDIETYILKAHDQEKDLQTLEILKKYIYYSKKSHCIRMKEIRKSIYNFDYEDLKEVFENE